MVKHFRCNNCGFEFFIAADFQNMSEEEYKEISACPCGAETKEMPLPEQ